MDAVQFLRAVRRRWILVTGTVMIALVVGWLSSAVVRPGPPIRSYRATAVLLSSEDPFTSTPGIYNLETIAALATVGEVPRRVAAQTGYEGDPLQLAQEIESVGEADTGLIRISAESTKPLEARRIAQAFADELVAFLGRVNTTTVGKETQTLARDIERLEAEVSSLDQQIASSSESEAQALSAQQSAKVQQLSFLYQRQTAIAEATASPVDLQIIQEAVPLLQPDQGFIQVRSLPSRLVLSGILGLFAAAGLVFVLERFDTRIRTKEAAEEQFDLPVLAEIPLMRRRARRAAGVSVASRPKSVTADAYRLLAAGVMRRPSTTPQVIMVTSAGPGEGKSTAVANLAAAYAEVGKKVLVISADLHRPAVHRLLSVPNTRGLSTFLKEGGIAAGGNGQPAKGLELDGTVWKTPIHNVRLIPSGPIAENPAELLASEAMRILIRHARELADIVLIDTAPILAVSDSAALIPETDAVVVVSWAGQTTAAAARRTFEVLQRLGAKVVGVGLVGVTEASLPRGYYQYYTAAREKQRQEQESHRALEIERSGDRR